jgi:hypothetical protein
MNISVLIWRSLEESTVSYFVQMHLLVAALVFLQDNSMVEFGKRC